MRYFLLLLTWSFISLEVNAQFVVNKQYFGVGGTALVQANITGSTDVATFSVIEVVDITGAQNTILTLRADNGYSKFTRRNLYTAYVPDVTNDAIPASASFTLANGYAARTYYLVPDTMTFNTTNGFIASASVGSTYSANATILPSGTPISSLVLSIDTQTITLSGSYNNGTFESGSGTTEELDNEPEPEIPDAELTAIGLELPDDYSPAPGDTIDVQVTAADGTVTDLTVDASSVSDNMTFALEGVVLGEGDSVSLNSTEWEAPIEGTVSTDWKDGFVWTDNNTTLLNSSGLVGGTTGSYTTSKSTASGSTVLSNTTYDTATNTVSTTKTKTEAVAGSGEDDTDGITYAEDLAGALDAAAKGKADGMAEGSAANADLYNALNDELTGLTNISDGLTDQAEQLIQQKNPYENAPTISSQSYSLSLPTPWGSIDYTIDPNQGWMQILRAIEYVVLAMMGFRLFFKILIV